MSAEIYNFPQQKEQQFDPRGTSNNKEDTNEAQTRTQETVRGLLKQLNSQLEKDDPTLTIPESKNKIPPDEKIRRIKSTNPTLYSEIAWALAARLDASGIYIPATVTTTELPSGEQVPVLMYTDEQIQKLTQEYLALITAEKLKQNNPQAQVSRPPIESQKEQSVPQFDIATAKTVPAPLQPPNAAQQTAMSQKQEQAIQKTQKELQEEIEKRERDKQRELINQALQAGRSTMVAWSTEGLGTITAGYRVVLEENDIREHQPDHNQPQLENVVNHLSEALGQDNYTNQQQSLADEGIYEAAIITRTKDYKENGFTNPAYVLYYHASDRHNGNKYNKDFAQRMGYPWSELKERKHLYKDGVKRPGNGLFEKLEFSEDKIRQLFHEEPEVFIQKLSAEIQKDPTFARKLTEAFVQQKYSEEFRKNVWENYGRPPYNTKDEQHPGWDQYPVNRMYFSDLVAHPEPPSSNKEQIEKHIIEFKTEGSLGNPDHYHASIIKKSS